MIICVPTAYLQAAIFAVRETFRRFVQDHPLALVHRDSDVAERFGVDAGVAFHGEDTEREIRDAIEIHIEGLRLAGDVVPLAFANGRLALFAG